MPPVPGAPPVPFATKAEWRPQSVGVTLLTLGVALLGLAALVFAVVAWPRLDDGQRAMLLAVATLLAGAVAVVTNRRLPSTSESLSGLFLAMLVVDWVAVRRAGLGDAMDPTQWWALGFAVFAAAGLGVGTWLRQRVPRAVAMVSGGLSGALWVLVATDSGRARVVGVALVAAVLGWVAALVRPREGWRAAAVAAVSTGGVLWALAAVAALGRSSSEDWTTAAASAAMALSLAAAPAAVRIRMANLSSEQSTWLVFVAGAAVCVAAADLLAVAIDDGAFASVWALAASGMVVLARLGPQPIRAGVGRLAAAVGGLCGLWAILALADILAVAVSQVAEPWRAVASTPLGELALIVEPSPMRGTPDLWNVLVPLALAAAGALSTLPMRGAPALTDRKGAAAVVLPAAWATVVLVPAAADLAVALAVVWTLAVATAAVAAAAMLERRADARDVSVELVVALSFAAAVLLVGLAWGSAARSATVLAVAGVFVIATASAFVLRSDLLKTAAAGVGAASFIVLAGIVPSALDAGSSTVAWSLGAASALAFLLGVHLLGRGQLALVVEVLGVAGMALSFVMQFGGGAATTSFRGPAAAATAAVAVFAVAAARDDRRAYAVVACGCALVAVWLWLAAAGVRMVEAYTLPAAGLALLSGFLMRRTPAGSHSWVAYGPGLLIAFTPSLLLVLSRGGTVRPVLLSIAALIVVLVGVAWKMQAPVVIGAATLLILAVDLLWPVVAQVERWIVLAVAGAIFLWLGATIEARMRNVRAVRGLLERMR